MKKLVLNYIKWLLFDLYFGTLDLLVFHNIYLNLLSGIRSDKTNITLM